MPITPHRTLRAVLVALVAAGLGLLTIAPAQAAAYRFWGYYELTNGAWAFAQKGPEQIVPKDGTVDGWRFAVSDTNGARYPRAVLTFDQICATTAAESGKKRVGLVVDYGRTADSEDAATPPAPVAKCALVGTDATSLDVLRTAGELRMDKGLLCAVSGYPTGGCGGEVKTVSAEAKAADTPVTIAAPSAAPSATAQAAAAPVQQPAAGVDDGPSAATWAAYVIIALLVIALGAYLAVRARAAKQSR